MPSRERAGPGKADTAPKGLPGLRTDAALKQRTAASERGRVHGVTDRASLACVTVSWRRRPSAILAGPALAGPALAGPGQPAQAARPAARP